MQNNTQKNNKYRRTNKLLFPAGFLWGTAISAYQTEGDNFNSDWWAWEEQGRTSDRSGKACDYWNRYQQDHALLEQLGVSVFRLSLEWARIEPEEGSFSQEALNHYREILQDLKRRNIKTQVTLWWWTSPLWFEQKYGFHRRKSIGVFGRYVERVVQALGEDIDIYTVLNEPMVPLGQGYLTGLFPPGFRSVFKFWRAHCNLAKAYKQAYQLIHKKNKDAMVGLSYLYNWYENEGGVFYGLVYRIAKWFRIDWFGRKVRGYQDYFGLNYYRLGKIVWDPTHSEYLGFRIEKDESNVMGWVSFPAGIYQALKAASRDYALPIFITENGMPDDIGLDDLQRVQFIREHLRFVHKAIEEGVEVVGYNYWSLMDNYEWLGGFHFRFGLAEVDYETMERKPRKSFEAYAKICKSNEVEI